MYINTGYQRAVELKVTRSTDGVITYTKFYSVLDEFGNFSEISADDFAKISVTDFQKRMEAFKSYVEGLEIGVSVDLSGIRRENLTACPISLK